MEHSALAGKELLIAALLGEHHELMGVDVMRLSKGQLVRGTVYVTLDRMKEKKLVQSRVIPPNRGEGIPPVRLYRLSSLGHRLLFATAMANKSFMLAMQSSKKALP